jgi:hypothetical protein
MFMQLTRLSKAPITLILILWSSLPARAADHSPSLDSLLQSIQSEIKPDQAMNFMRQIYSTDRWFTFPKFEETAEYLKRTMGEIGLKDVELLGAPADGVSQAGFWTMPLAWDAKSARLEILDKDIPPQERILVDYQKIPASLGMWSGPTPPDGITAEVVEVHGDDGAAIAQMPLKGKLVLTDRNPANFKWALVKAGALGAINAFTENTELSDGRQWINAWGDNGWAFTKMSTPLLSFSISPNQAALVRKLLAERAPVRVRATVDTRYYSGVYPYVTGVIRGTGPEQVLTLGHSSEQGAEDNATGVAAIMESLATINRLIEDGRLPRPKRSIRIFVMGEMYGSMHYVATHPDQIHKTVAAMCVDTPAASYSLAGTEYTFYMNPEVAKSYTDAFILKIAAEYFPKVGRPWHSHAFMSGTDTYLAEPTVNVPIVWPYSGSGVETHHNSEDTPDRVDPRSLRDVAIVNAAYLYYLANAGEPEAEWLAELSETRGYEQILHTASQFLDQIETARNKEDLGRVQGDALDHIAYRVDRESQSVLSVLRLMPEGKRGGLNMTLAPMVEKLHQFGVEQSGRVRRVVDHKALELGLSLPIQSTKIPVPQAPEMSKIVILRKRYGTLPLDDIPPDQREGYPSGAWAGIPTAALYWCDGHRNLAEVIHLTQMELGRTDFDFLGYFKFLRAHGYVDFRGD